MHDVCVGVAEFVGQFELVGSTDHLLARISINQTAMHIIINPVLTWQHYPNPSGLLQQSQYYPY